MKKKILYVSDMGVLGSGYKNIGVAICHGLSQAGHDVKVAGLAYKGEEHPFDFSIIPAPNLNVLKAVINNLCYVWQYDILIVALDIPLQEAILSMRDEILSSNPNLSFKYWGIFPVESDPMSSGNARQIMKMDKRFIISEFGTLEAVKAGVDAEFLPIGVDHASWKVPTKEEKQMFRSAYGLGENTFVVLTVADNQERKFLSRTAQILGQFKKEVSSDILWVLVTKIHSSIGWNLTDLVVEMGLSQNYLPFERGLPFKELYSLYAISDAFLLTSKAEGLGMPVLEAMAAGVPVVATNCTGMKESMSKGGGFPIEYERFEHRWIDPFGNQTRYFASVASGVQQLKNVYTKQGVKEQVSKARGYVESLGWDRTVITILRAIENE